MKAKFIHWECNNNILWALDPVDTKAKCRYLREHRCTKPCSGFPDQEWRDINIKFVGFKTFLQTSIGVHERKSHEGRAIS